MGDVRRRIDNGRKRPLSRDTMLHNGQDVTVREMKLIRRTPDGS
jgi:hypothetical protein